MEKPLKEVCRLMHFHAVDDSIYYYATAVIRKLLRCRLRAGRACFEFELSAEEFDTLMLYQEQMETLYEHPRSVSKRYRAFWKEKAENQVKVISNRIEREHEKEKKSRKNRFCQPELKKNLS